MCGIFGVISSRQKNLPQTVFQGLKALEYRGYDSWGIAAESQSQGKKSKFILEKHTGKIGTSTLNSNLLTLNSNLALGHTRWATHGGVTVKNAHPHLDCTGQLALVHNGIVENFEELKKSLINKHKFRSETDTEVIVHLIEDLQKTHSFEEAVRQAFLKLKGLNAIVVGDLRTGQIGAAKNGSPLVVGTSNSASRRASLAESRRANYIASDQIALSAHCSQIFFLEDNRMVLLSADKISLTDLKTGKALKPKFVAPKVASLDLSLGKYHHFMEKEINEQPQIIGKIASLDARRARHADGQIKTAANLIKHLPAGRQIYLIGSGTASYAAQIMQYLLSTINKINSQAVAASEFENVVNFIKKGDLVCAYSQSGETADLITAATLAKEKGAKILALTNVAGSTLDRLADHSIHLNAGPEIAVVSTKAFTAKIAVSLILCFEIAGKTQKAQQMLTKLSKALEKQLASPKITPIVSLLAHQKSLFTIGRNIDYPLALETALKFKETAYIHAEGFAAGELKHGVIALVEKGTPVLVFATQRKYLQEATSSAQELKARGARLIGISPQNNPVFDYYLPVPALEFANLIPAVVYAQYLAYLIALKRGLDPDKPRNLAKSVTVK